MRLGIKVAVAVVVVFLVSGFATVLAAPTAKLAGNHPVPLSSGSSPKIHLIEVQTGTWCIWCGDFDPSVGRLVEEWGDNVVMVGYHCCSGAFYDPFYDAAVDGPRVSFYGSNYYPTTIVDGGGATYGNDNPLFFLGISGTPPGYTDDRQGSYDWVRSNTENFADTSSNIAISVTGDLTPTGATATATITATDPVPQTNLYVRILLYEDEQYAVQTKHAWVGGSGPAQHANVLRALNEQTLSIMQGQTVTKTATFTLSPSWRTNNLGVAAFVQSNTKRPITITGYPTDTFYVSDVLNAAKHDFTPPGVLVYGDTGTTADYAEYYQIPLALQGEHFRTWDTYNPPMDTGGTDIKDPPTAAALAESPALIWNTGGRTAPILSPTDRTLIQSHLDGGPGSLLIAGDGIGFDGATNYQPWMQQYLHAQYNGEPGVFSVTGVVGNPVSDSFSSTTLNLLAGSAPDRISTFGGNAAVPFQYTGGLPGSVNAQHDADSRVVYLGFRYFDGSDVNRGPVLTKILDWLDGAAAPTVSVVYPAGGESLAKGSTATLKWTAYDVRIPANGVDIYFSDNYPTNPWTTVATGEPNDGVYAWTVPNLDSSNCQIRIVARDSTGQSAAAVSNKFTCGVPAPPPFSLSFTGADLGWHFISYPTQAPDTSVNAILSSITGSYSIARWYDAFDATDHWKSYIPGTATADLATVDNTMGFWIKITAPCTLTETGAWPATPTAVALHAGWNMVGFPSRLVAYTVANLKADTGATMVQGFDGTAGPYYLQDLFNPTPLVAGNAYWVYVPADTTWNVPV